MASLNKALLCELYSSGKSLPDVSAEVGLSQSTVRYHLLRCGIKMRDRAQAVRMASGKISAAHAGKPKAKWSQESKDRLSAIRFGSGKGYSIKKGGYVQLTSGPHKHRGLHSVIMEALIGRPLAEGECVHHIDENKHNNDPRNLRLMTRSTHTHLHRTKELNGLS